MRKENRRHGTRRQIERRAPKAGVNARHDDKSPEDIKRFRRGRLVERDKDKT